MTWICGTQEKGNDRCACVQMRSREYKFVGVFLHCFLFYLIFWQKLSGVQQSSGKKIKKDQVCIGEWECVCVQSVCFYFDACQKSCQKINSFRYFHHLLLYECFCVLLLFFLSSLVQFQRIARIIFLFIVSVGILQFFLFCAKSFFDRRFHSFNFWQ